jgi:L,D-transpeptidase ErfK/SrfK
MRTRLVVVALAATLVASVAFADTPGAAIGTHLTADHRHIVPGAVSNGGIVINLPQRMLFYEVADTPFEIPIAVGRPTWQTPTGEFSIVEKRANPVWHVPPSIMAESQRLGHDQKPVVPPGPDNPLGKFWLGTSLPGIGVHGTIAPSSIGRAVTHGCIRAGTEDIRRLFESVEVDTPGEVMYQPILLANVDGTIYLEVQPDMYHRLAGPPLDAVKELAAQAGVSSAIDWTKAAAVVAAHEGIATAVTAGRKR